MAMVLTYSAASSQGADVDLGWRATFSGSRRRSWIIVELPYLVESSGEGSLVMILLTRISSSSLGSEVADSPIDGVCGGSGDWPLVDDEEG